MRGAICKCDISPLFTVAYEMWRIPVEIRWTRLDVWKSDRCLESIQSGWWGVERSGYSLEDPPRTPLTLAGNDLVAR